MYPFQLRKNEEILWHGRESIWGSTTVTLFIIGSVLALMGGLFLIYTINALPIFLMGVILLAIGIRNIRRFSIYVISNKRLIEIKQGRTINELNLEQLIESTSIASTETIETALDIFFSTLLGITTRGFIPTILRIANIIIKDRQGNIVFRFRRVRIKEVKKNLDEAIRRIMESAISRNH